MGDDREADFALEHARIRDNRIFDGRWRYTVEFPGSLWRLHVALKPPRTLWRREDFHPTVAGKLTLDEIPSEAREAVVTSVAKLRATGGLGK